MDTNAEDKQYMNTIHSIDYSVQVLEDAVAVFVPFIPSLSHVEVDENGVNLFSEASTQPFALVKDLPRSALDVAKVHGLMFFAADNARICFDHEFPPEEVAAIH